MGVTYTRHGAAIYRSQQWKAVRLLAKRRDGFRCVKCLARGRLEVDHILPIRTHPDLAFDLANLQSLCPACHSRKTAIETGITPLDPERQKWRDLLTRREAAKPRAGTSGQMDPQPVAMTADPLEGNPKYVGICEDSAAAIGNP